MRQVNKDRPPGYSRRAFFGMTVTATGAVVLSGCGPKEQTYANVIHGDLAWSEYKSEVLLPDEAWKSSLGAEEGEPIVIFGIPPEILDGAMAGKLASLAIFHVEGEQNLPSSKRSSAPLGYDNFRPMTAPDGKAYRGIGVSRLSGLVAITLSAPDTLPEQPTPVGIGYVGTYDGLRWPEALRDVVVFQSPNS
jgi:hypothetical protein